MEQKPTLESGAQCQPYYRITVGISAQCPLIISGTCGMFDWTLFDNSNQTKVVRQPKKLGCSPTKLTIQIKQKLFDNLKSWDVRRQNWQLSNKKLIELSQKGDYVWLILISTLIVEQNINQTKSGKWLCSINVMFDK